MSFKKGKRLCGESAHTLILNAVLEMNAYWRTLYTFRDMRLYISGQLSFLDFVKSVEMSLVYLEKAQMHATVGEQIIRDESRIQPLCLTK